jgi:hypothetical protein
MALGGVRGRQEGPAPLPEFKSPECGKVGVFLAFPRPNAKIVTAITVEQQRRR